MFEMLGIGRSRLFQKEQLPWIWEFLRRTWIAKDKLYVTLFEGNDFITKDLESYEIWKSLVLPTTTSFTIRARKIGGAVPAPRSDALGEIGGPTSEIFFKFEALYDKNLGIFVTQL